MSAHGAPVPIGRLFRQIQLVPRLQVHPEPRRDPEVALQPHGRVGADAAAGVDDGADAVLRHLDGCRQPVGAELERFEKILLQRHPGVDGNASGVPFVMTDIDELRQRVEEAERSFGLIDEQHANYSGRLVTLIDAIRQALDERQLAVDRLSQENEQLRTMLLSLLHAIEAGSGKGFSDIMTGIEGELSAMISGSPAPPPPEAEPASPHPEEAPSEDDALEEVASEAEAPDSEDETADEADDMAAMMDEAVAPDDEAEAADKAADLADMMAEMDEEEISFETADPDGSDEPAAPGADDEAADKAADLAAMMAEMDEEEVSLEAADPDGNDEPAASDGDAEAADEAEDMAAMMDEVAAEMAEEEISFDAAEPAADAVESADKISPEPDTAGEAAALDDSAAESPEGKVSDLKQILDGIRESIGDVSEDEPSTPST